MSNKTDLIQNNEALQTLLTRVEELPSKQDFEDLQAELDAANESWAGTLTFSGSYANSTYFTEAGCSLAIDKQKGMAFITVQSGTNTSYENIVFSGSHVLPTGVTALASEPYGYSHNTTKLYYTKILTGITGKINVAVALNSTTTNSIIATLTVTYA